MSTKANATILGLEFLYHGEGTPDLVVPHLLQLIERGGNNPTEIKHQALMDAYDGINFSTGSASLPDYDYAIAEQDGELYISIFGNWKVA